nr:unnamed protein product [Callosobruchus chinensis]
MNIKMSASTTPTFNNEYYIALECKDLQANAMAIDSSGNYVLLGGRRYLAIRNLKDEYEVVQKYPRQSKYDVGVAEWNPTQFHKELCVISSNQRLEVVTTRLDDLSQTHSLRAHTRVITDLNWHKSDPNLIASCSVDTFIHIWDLRDPKRPTLSLSAVAEASQVKWNRLSPHLLATAHEGDIKIWDQRKGTVPMQYIAAHLSKIHGLDWSPKSENYICSSSQDSTVKYFDITNSRKAEFVLTTSAPVWRARHTPFGNGLVTAVVPQLRRGENSLQLWNTANRSTPVHTFIGHRDVILDFDWRKQHPNDLDFQLVTWSKDQTLLVWKIEPFIQKLCGHEPAEVTLGSEVSIEANESRLSRKNSPKVQPLHQEFSLLNVHIPNLTVKKMDPVARSVAVKVTIHDFLVHLQVSFPSAYPYGVSPIFQVMPGSAINDNASQQLLQMLKHLAQQRVTKNRTCLEPCLRQMVTTLEQLSASVDSNKVYDRTYIEPTSNMYGGYNDVYIPFPKTSGAKFCSVGTLVCFSRPSFSRRVSSKSENSSRAPTPRALSALENHFAKQTSDYMTISTYYYQRQRSRVKNSKHSRTVVHIYDAVGLFFMNRQLAEEYILDGDLGTVCKHNGAAAAVVGRSDLVQAWTLAELVAGQPDDKEIAMSRHPFGSKLMESLINHYASQYDIQMAAMLCCIFGKEMSRKSAQNSTGATSPYHTIPPADVVADGWVFPMLRTKRSTSLDNLRVEIPASVPAPKPQSALYQYYKMAYAETLHRWGLIYNRTEVLKYTHRVPETHKGVEFVSECTYCERQVKQYGCVFCKRLALHCAVCGDSVRGLANSCAPCGHGGHRRCLQWWFRKKNVCPTGCGCRCMSETARMFDT